jgi:hypothetical protein
VDRALRIRTSTEGPATILLSFVTALSAVRLQREFGRIVYLSCAFRLSRFIYEHCSFTITHSGVLWPSQLRTTCIDVQIYKKMSRALHSSSPSGGCFLPQSRARDLHTPMVLYMHVSGVRFPLRSIYSTAKSNLYLVVGAQGRSGSGSKEKNPFACRKLSPGSPGCIHNRSDNVKPLN